MNRQPTPQSFIKGVEGTRRSRPLPLDRVVAVQTILILDATALRRFLVQLLQHRGYTMLESDTISKTLDHECCQINLLNLLTAVVSIPCHGIEAGPTLQARLQKCAANRLWSGISPPCGKAS